MGVVRGSLLALVDLHRSVQLVPLFRSKGAQVFTSRLQDPDVSLGPNNGMPLSVFVHPSLPTHWTHVTEDVLEKSSTSHLDAHELRVQPGS